jgi:hypothetical protein
MSIMLDIMGSVIIAGLMVIMLMKFNIYQSTTKFASDSELQMQQNSKTLAEIIDHDFRKIGYDYDSTAFVQADSEKVSFFSDIDRNGSIDFVSYFLGDPSEVTGTTNPNDRILYRVVNSDTISGPSLGLTKAKFSYLDEVYTETDTLSNIKYVRAELWVESIEPVGEEYIFTYWELTINPRNL